MTRKNGQNQNPAGFFVTQVACSYFHQAMNAVRRSQSSEVLTEAEEVSAFLLELGHFFNDWRFALPDVLNMLQVNETWIVQIVWRLPCKTILKL